MTRFVHRVGRWRAPRRFRRAVLLVIAVTLLGLVTGCSCEDRPKVVSLHLADDAVFAEVLGWDGFAEPSWFRSDDAGSTWAAAAAPRLGGDDRPPVTEPRCDGDRCYRVADTAGGPDAIEQSDDGGITWQTVWNRGADRRPFFEDCAAPADATDIVLVPAGRIDDPSGSAILLVAMTELGVLRRDLGGTWESVSVGEAVSTDLAGAPPAFHFLVSLTIVLMSMFVLSGVLVGGFRLRRCGWSFCVGWSARCIALALGSWWLVYASWSLGVIERWSVAWPIATGIAVAGVLVVVATARRRPGYGAPPP